MKVLREQIAFLLVCILTSCTAGKVEQLPVYRNMDDLKGAKVATATGWFQEILLERDYPEIEVMRVDNATDVVQALLTRRCEAIAMDDYYFYYQSPSSLGITALDVELATAGLGAGFGKGANVELREQFNAFLKQIRSDGTYDKLYDSWIYNAEGTELPDIQHSGTGKPIRVITCSVAPPMSFIRNGELAGFDIELVTRFAASIGRSVEWTDVNFSAMIPALVSGSHDMMVGGICITPERKESVDFSDSYYRSYTVISIRNENSEGYVAGTDGAEKGFSLKGIKESIRRNIVEEKRYLMILSGLRLTIFISLMSVLFGTLLGALICWMRMNRRAALRKFAEAYVGLMRGVPVLVLLMIMFYVVFAGTSIGAVAVSVITFGMNFAAYVSEMFRTSIESVDKGQTEAGIAIGFTPARTFCYIVMPQAFRRVLPVYKGEVISLVKMTSIVGYIAVQDLTKVGDIIRSRTFDAFFPLVMVAFLYFLVSWLFASMLDFIGKKVEGV